MGLWVYEFSGRPGRADEQLVGQAGVPGRMVVMERPGGGGVVDGYVREGLDERARVVRLRWVAAGNPTEVTVAVLKTVGLIPVS